MAFQCSILVGLVVGSLIAAVVWFACRTISDQYDARTKMDAEGYLDELLGQYMQTPDLEDFKAAFAEDDIIMWSEQQSLIRMNSGHPMPVLFDPDGNWIAGTSAVLTSDPLKRETLDVVGLERDAWVASGMTRDGYTSMVAEFIDPRQALARNVGSFGVWIAAGTSLVLSLAVGIAMAFATTTRLNALTNAVRSLGQGKLAARVPQANTANEYAMLTMEINNMLDQMRSLAINMETATIGVAHDLRTPLTNIGGQLELIRV